MSPSTLTELQVETADLGDTLASSWRVEPRARTWLSILVGLAGLAVGVVGASLVSDREQWGPWGWPVVGVIALLTLAGWFVPHGHARALAGLRERLAEVLGRRRDLADRRDSDPEFVDDELSSVRNQMLEAYARTRFPGLGAVLALAPFLLLVAVSGYLALAPATWDATETDRLAVTLVTLGGVPGLLALGRSAWVTASAEIGLVNQCQRYLRHVESLARTHHPELELGGPSYASRALRDPRIAGAVLVLASAAVAGFARLLG